MKWRSSMWRRFKKFWADSKLPEYQQFLENGPPSIKGNASEGPGSGGWG